MIKKVVEFARRRTGVFSTVAVALLAAVAFASLYRLLADIRLRDIAAALHALSAGRVACSLALSALSYFLLTIYDVLALRQVGRPLPYRTAALASFISYTLSHNLGLSLLTGGSARYRIYSAAGVPGADVARIMALVGLTFWTGTVIASALALAVTPVQLSVLGLIVPASTAHEVGAALITAVVLTVLLLRKGQVVSFFRMSLPLPGRRNALLLAAVSMADLFAASGALWVLLPEASLAHFPSFFVVYVIAILVSLIAHVPGGLGIFEALIIVGLTRQPSGEVAAALLLYRAIYYWLPLSLAAAGLTLHEGARWRRRLESAASAAQSILSSIAAPLFATLSMAGGLVLLISGALPAIPQRLAALRMVVPLPFVEASHIGASLAGTALLLLAPALYRRLDGAFVLARTLLLVGAVFSLLKGFDFEEALVLCAIAMLLQWSRAAFYRRTRLTVELLSARWIAAFMLAIGISMGLVVLTYRHVAYGSELWWQFAWNGDASRSLRASVAAAVFLLAVIVQRSLSGATPRTNAVDVLPPTFAEAARYSGTAAFLALTGDKRFIKLADGYLMYQVQGHSWIAMGDPVGPKVNWPDMLWNLRERAHTMQGRLLLYQISAAAIPYAIDLGLSLIKYGEEAHVNLVKFSAEWRRSRSLRYAHNRAEREGATFDIISAEQVSNMLGELTAVSDEWLAQRGGSEKAFSVARFEPSYLLQFDVAVVRISGRVVAFGNILQTAGREELSVELMRHRTAAPYGAMDFLFIKLMEWGANNGFLSFNLGVAPLAGITDRRLAPLWAKAGGLLQRHGENFYSFSGLRAFKRKFDPTWEPRYIAGPSGFAMVRALIDLQTLVGGGDSSAAVKTLEERKRQQKEPAKTRSPNFNPQAPLL